VAEERGVVAVDDFEIGRCFGDGHPVPPAWAGER
jgi:hypothetical protein